MERDYLRDKDKTALERPQFSLDPPHLTLLEPADAESAPSTGRRLLLDCSCHLSSRQFDGVANSVIRRALDAQVGCIVVDTLDFSKVDDVMALVKEHTGVLYASVGVSPDSIKVHSRTHTN